MKFIFYLFLTSFFYYPLLYSQIQPGDSLQFWSVAYIDIQPIPPTEQRLINAVCKEVGEYCYVFIDTEVSNTPSTQQIDFLINIFDSSFVPGLTHLYGPVPDEFDNDIKIYLLIIPSEGWVGYFDPAHQMEDSTVWQNWSKHSNQKEIIYLSDQVFNYGADIVLAHEFGHMLHWGRDHSPEPPNNPVKYWEDAWIDEGFATFAPVYLIEDVTHPDVYDNQAFFAFEPDLSLIHFLGGSSYNQVKLWMTYMFEHFDGEDYISTLINEQANGIPGVMKTLENLGYEELFDETFDQWITANFLDNKTYLNGKYGYHHYNFPPCRLAATYNQFPTGIKTGSVSSYACDYIQFSSTTPRDIRINFDGVDTSKFRISFLKLGNNNSQIFSVESAQPDSLNRVAFYSDSLGMDIQRIIMIVMNTDTSLGENKKAGYLYSAESITGIHELSNSQLNYHLYQNYPNPFNPITKIQYQIQEFSFVTLKVYDVLGNKIETIVNEEKSAGTYEITWDAESLPSGVYFYQLKAGDPESSLPAGQAGSGQDFIQTKKMLLLR